MTIARCLALALPALFATAAFAQTPPAPAGEKLPTDPAQLLQRMADANGLHGAKAQPWHLHATWKSLDAQGQVSDQGTLEEWWAAEKRYKLVYTYAKGQQIVYGTDQGRMAVKTDAGNSFAMVSIENWLSWPAPPVTPEGLKRMHLELVPWQAGGLSLECILQTWNVSPGQVFMTVDKSGQRQPMLNRYCFDPGTVILRVRTDPFGSITTLHSLVRFQGQYVARAVHSAWTTGQKTDIDVDAIESLDSINDAEVAPPAGSDLVPYVRKVAVSSGVMAGNRIGGKDPTYPMLALDERIQGTVVLQATIQREGTVGNLKVISGPPELQQAALDAVKTWRYKPYTINGEPVEVETQINVVFALGH